MENYSACHAGGREFESRPSRHFKERNLKGLRFFVAEDGKTRREFFQNNNTKGIPIMPPLQADCCVSKQAVLGYKIQTFMIQKPVITMSYFPASSHGSILNADKPDVCFFFGRLDVRNVEHLRY